MVEAANSARCACCRSSTCREAGPMKAPPGQSKKRWKERRARRPSLAGRDRLARAQPDPLRHRARSGRGGCRDRTDRAGPPGARLRRRAAAHGANGARGLLLARRRLASKTACACASGGGKGALEWMREVPRIAVQAARRAAEAHAQRPRLAAAVGPRRRACRRPPGGLSSRASPTSICARRHQLRAWQGRAASPSPR